MYLIGLIAFALGVGLVVLGVFMVLVSKEKRKGSISLGIGTVIIIAVMVLYTSRPPVAGVELITVKETAVSQHEDGAYRCSVTDAETEIDYHYEADSQEGAESFCGQFEVGSDYKITFEYELNSEEYKLRELVDQG